MSNRTILILLGAAAVVVTAALLAGKGGGPKPSPQVAPTTSKATSEAKPTQQETAVPQAQIAVDGKGDDWSSVPALLVPKPDRWDTRTYNCQAVKCARDEKNLYVLFVLGLGIRERYDRQMQAGGPPSSGALGYLKFQTEGKQFSIWVPTGVSQTFGKTGQVIKSLPTADFEVSRYNPATQGWGKIFAAESENGSEFIGFDGKLLEIKLPLEKLGIAGTFPISASLREM